MSSRPFLGEAEHAPVQGVLNMAEIFHAQAGAGCNLFADPREGEMGVIVTLIDEAQRNCLLCLENDARATQYHWRNLAAVTIAIGLDGLDVFIRDGALFVENGWQERAVPGQCQGDGRFPNVDLSAQREDQLEKNEQHDRQERCGDDDQAPRVQPDALFDALIEHYRDAGEEGQKHDESESEEGFAPATDFIECLLGGAGAIGRGDLITQNVDHLIRSQNRLSYFSSPTGGCMSQPRLSPQPVVKTAMPYQ